MLNGKNIVVGVCGGIAAYKAVEVVSRLRKACASVDVVMTENAARFVTPLTFQSIAHSEVVTDMFAPVAHWYEEHISLAKKADLLVVVPATANVIGKAASGIADDMLTTVLMATRAPVLFVPAMNTGMWEHPVYQQNMHKLMSLGYHFMEPDTGRLANGDEGKGRLPEPAEIVRRIEELLSPEAPLDMKGLNVLVTAGPTRESIDPVRYITNHSSGKMGYAFASAARDRGAGVRLITGPVSIPPPEGVEVVRVVTAEEMFRAVMDTYMDAQIIILVAAVADYRCESVAVNKIKKTGDQMTLKLVRNPDIAMELGRVKGKRVVVGACAETEDLVKNARSKLEKKKFDLIMANDVTMEGAGFGADTNIVKIIGKDGSVLELPIQSKLEVAGRVLDEVMKMREDDNGS